MKPLLRRLLLVLSIILCLSLLAFSQTRLGSYLLSGALGHIRILAARESIDELLADPDLDATIRSQLQLVKDVRAFAITELKLPHSNSYTSITFIQRKYPGWNVYAAPQLSTQPQRWCFWVVGCVVYRGYFSRQQAQDFAADFAAENGFDTHVSPFIGYSSLGYLPDPLLGTQLRLPPGRLAALVIHEMAHQRLYIPGKSKINEAFARVVEREGVSRWLQHKGELGQLKALQQHWQRVETHAQMVIATRNALSRIYSSSLAAEEKLRQKNVLLLKLQQRLCGEKCAHLTHPGINNASLIPYTTYSEELAFMQELFAQVNNDFAAFYKLVETRFLR